MSFYSTLTQTLTSTTSATKLYSNWSICLLAQWVGRTMSDVNKEAAKLRLEIKRSLWY